MEKCTSGCGRVSYTQLLRKHRVWLQVIRCFLLLLLLFWCVDRRMSDGLILHNATSAGMCSVEELLRSAHQETPLPGGAAHKQTNTVQTTQ